jgi:hypothetical protein
VYPSPADVAAQAAAAWRQYMAAEASGEEREEHEEELELDAERPVDMAQAVRELRRCEAQLAEATETMRRVSELSYATWAAQWATAAVPTWQQQQYAQQQLYWQQLQAQNLQRLDWSVGQPAQREARVSGRSPAPATPASDEEEPYFSDYDDGDDEPFLQEQRLLAAHHNQLQWHPLAAAPPAAQQAQPPPQPQLQQQQQQQWQQQRQQPPAAALNAPGDQVGEAAARPGLVGRVVVLIDLQLIVKLAILCYFMLDGENTNLVSLLVGCTLFYLYETGCLEWILGSREQQREMLSRLRLLEMTQVPTLEHRPPGLAADAYVLLKSFVLSLVPAWQPV